MLPFCSSYMETFEGLADPSAISAVDRSLVSGTNNPTTVSTEFATNDNENIVKITAVSDAGSMFTWAHPSVEKELWTTGAPDNGVDPNNFDTGDVLVYTTEPVILFAASRFNINGVAELSVVTALGLYIAPGIDASPLGSTRTRSPTTC